MPTSWRCGIPMSPPAERQAKVNCLRHVHGARRARPSRSRCRAARKPSPACTVGVSGIGLATNDSTGGAEKTLLALGIAQMFDAAYGYDAVANPKPAPDSIYAFSDLTGLKPSEIAMVGDNRHDLEMAKAGGAASPSACSRAPAPAKA